MKIRTTEMLSDKLSQELSWRKKELSSLLYFVEKSSQLIKAKGVLPRCGIALLYAHWEGFIKLGARYYLEFISMQRLKNEELNDNLLTMIIKNEIMKRAQAIRVSQYYWITEFFMRKSGDRCLIPYKTIIDTESNLSSKVLKDILWCLGLDYSLYESNEKLNDLKLLANRNLIAHGEKRLIDVDDYLELHDKIIELMDIFRNQLENAALTKKFFREM